MTEPRQFGPCTKCGWEEVVVGFEPLWTIEACGAASSAHELCYEEHFHILCARCGYCWSEAV